MTTEVDPAVLSYSHLQGYPAEDEALHMLKRIASLVKPLMRARGWKVKQLAEMDPHHANLLGLNINKGEQILLRLRDHSDRSQFLPFGKIVDTMLHELAHIVHGPHGVPFHNLWGQLREELDRMMMKGYTGEGFLGNGQRLGDFGITPRESRRLARRGHRLGGRPPVPGEGLREGFLQTLERQSSMALGCANHSSIESEIQKITKYSAQNGFRTQAEEDAANEAAMAQALWELVQEDKRRNPKQPPPEPQPPSKPGGYWACLSCTFHNPTHVHACGVCEAPRPRRTVIDLTNIPDSPPRLPCPPIDQGWKPPGVSRGFPPPYSRQPGA